MTVELIDTESGESRCSEGEEGGDGGGAGRASDHPDAAYLERFLAPPFGCSLSLETRRRLAQRPVFLCRSVTSYRRRVRHRIVPRPKQEERFVFQYRSLIIQEELLPKIKGMVVCCTRFVYFIFFLHYMVPNKYTGTAVYMMKLVGDDL